MLHFFLFSHLVLADSLQPHGPRGLPGFLGFHYLLEIAQIHVHWVGDATQPFHPVSPFSSCPQPFPSSGSFPMSQCFASVGQSNRALASASALPMNIQDWFPLGLTGLISLLSKGLSRVFSNTSLKASILWRSVFFMVHLSHPYMITGKTIALTRWTFVGKVVSLLFNILSRFVTAFLPKSKHLLISWGFWLTYT